MNIILLCKWWWKLDKENGLWQKIIRHKYLRDKYVCTVKHRQSDSPVWAGLIKIKHIYLQGRKVVINDGQDTLFWHDIWLYDKPISLLFPDLFKMSQQQEISVCDAVSHSQQMSFSRHLVDRWRLDWGKIIVLT